MSIVDAILTLRLLAGLVVTSIGVVPMNAASFQTNSIEGWRVLVNERLLAEDKAATEKALGLLRVQLQEIVRVPTDTPPGNNAPAAELTAGLLDGMGHRVERYPVPQALLREYGMQSVTNLIVRHRFGDGGPVIALNAYGDVASPGEGWTKPP